MPSKRSDAELDDAAARRERPLKGGGQPIEASRQSRSDDHDLVGGVDQHPDADREGVATRGRLSCRYQ